MSYSKAEISIYVLPKRLYQKHTSDKVPLARRGLDSFHAFNITVKDQHGF